MFIECFQKLYYGPMIQKVLRKTVYKRKFFLITREMHEAQYYQKKKKEWRETLIPSKYIKFQPSCDWKSVEEKIEL